MVFDESSIKNIYNNLCDEESKIVYIGRLNYSLTHDYGFLKSMIDNTVRNRTYWKRFCEEIKNKSETENLVIFGAGMWGNILYQETRHFVKWKKAVDTDPNGKRLGDLSVTKFDEFINTYSGETIVVSSYKNYSSMREQLRKAGILEQKIINAGKVIYHITEGAIYFDLKELLPLKDDEIFIDGGCYDGMETKRFFEWTSGKGFSYCFEPDKYNICSIKEKLGDDKRYKIIPKALWSQTATLYINAKGDSSSSVGINGRDEEKIEATALDDVIKNERVTFIKMDIEGAEVEAIRGAQKIIAEQKPRLAVSIYHKTDDIWEIPSTILSCYSGYKFYLRHYSFSDYDTVLYALP